MNMNSGIIIIGDMAISMNGWICSNMPKISVFIFSFVVVGYGILERTFFIAFGIVNADSCHQVAANINNNAYFSH